MCREFDHCLFCLLRPYLACAVLQWQTMDDRMKTLDEDAQVLVNPSFVSEKDGKMHSATQQAIDTVKEQVEELKKTYKELTDLCQQKRDLFIVCVKFHMTTRQVSIQLS